MKVAFSIAPRRRPSRRFSPQRRDSQGHDQQFAGRRLGVEKDRGEAFPLKPPLGQPLDFCGRSPQDPRLTLDFFTPNPARANWTTCS
jgi:hypothetical protein